MFNDLSTSRLEGVDPRLVGMMEHLRMQEGLPPFQITEGIRSPEMQQRYYDEGKSKTLNSRHLTGNAVDIHIVDPVTGAAVWDEAAYAPIGAAAKEYAALNDLPFTWGGDWGWDSVHFQLDGPQNALASAPPRIAQPVAAEPARNALDPRIEMARRMNLLAQMPRYEPEPLQAFRIEQV